MTFHLGAKATFMFGRWLLILILPLSISGCSPLQSVSKPNASQTDVIKVTENHKYKLEAVFSGYDVEVGERTEKVIDSLTIRSQVTGQEVKHARVDGPAQSLTRAYITDLWSPDEEFMVMPRSQLKFCIIRAAEALDSIQKQTCSDTVSVYVQSGPSLFLDFEKWDGDEAFIFKAGLYGDDTRLKYEISSGRLTALDSNIIKIEGMNSKGKLAIGKSR
jgi:hypothetical protein